MGSTVFASAALTALFERGGASTGQALAAVSEETRRAVREEVRRGLADADGPIEVEAEYWIANGRR